MEGEISDGAKVGICRSTLELDCFVRPVGVGRIGSEAVLGSALLFGAVGVKGEKVLSSYGGRVLKEW